MKRTDTENDDLITIKLDFENILEFVQYSNKNTNDYNYSRRFKKSQNFCPMSFDDTVKDTLTGKLNIDNIRFEKIQNKIKSITPSKETSSFYDVTGNVLDIGRYVTGEPECFENEIETDGKEMLTIGINFTMSCRALAEDIANRAYYIASMIDYLSNYYYIDIKLFDCTSRLKSYLVRGKEIKCITSINVSSFPIDIRTIFKACNPGFLRRLMFGVHEIITDESNLNFCSYGWCSDIVPDEINGRFLYFPSNAILPTRCFSYEPDTVMNEILHPAIDKLARGERFVVVKEQA